MEFFISTLLIRTPNKFQNIKHFGVVLISFKDIKWMKDIFRIFIRIFCKNYVYNFQNIKHFLVDFFTF